MSADRFAWQAPAAERTLIQPLIFPPPGQHWRRGFEQRSGRVLPLWYQGCTPWPDSHHVIGRDHRDHIRSLDMLTGTRGSYSGGLIATQGVRRRRSTLALLAARRKQSPAETPPPWCKARDRRLANFSEADFIECFTLAHFLSFPQSYPDRFLFPPLHLSLHRKLLQLWITHPFQIPQLLESAASVEL